MMWQHVLDMIDRQLESVHGDQSDQDSSHGQDTSDDDTLPAYQSLGDLDPLFQNTTSNATKSDSTRAQQGFRNTYSNKERSNAAWRDLTIILLERHSPQKVPGAAVLRIRCDDVARLKREGFFCSNENILPEEGYMSDKTYPQWPSLGFHHAPTWTLVGPARTWTLVEPARTWTLVDKSNGDDPRWIARLDVLTGIPELLPRFEIHLSRRNVRTASAWNPLRGLFSQYDYSSHRRNCNCIYGDPPLQRWRPWPWEVGTRPVRAFLVRQWEKVGRRTGWKEAGRVTRWKQAGARILWKQAGITGEGIRWNQVGRRNQVG